MRNLALMWVLAACLLGCGGRDKDAKDKAVSAADTADTVAVVADTIATDMKEYECEDVLKLMGDKGKDLWFYCDPLLKVTLTGNRNIADILLIMIMQNYTTPMLCAHYRYTQRIYEYEEPAPTSKIVVKIAIDEFGNVVFANVVESDVTGEFRDTVVNIINGWFFERIDKPGDTTVFTFPFEFYFSSTPIAECRFNR